MKRHTPINAQIVGLGVDAFLKMLLVDNFVHTDLHPGNILFRAVPRKVVAKQQRVKQQQKAEVGKEVQTALQQQEQQSSSQGRRRRWQFWRSRSSSSSSSSSSAGTAEVSAEAAGPEQWEVELQQMIGQQQQRWASKHVVPGADGCSSATDARLAAAAAAASPVMDEAALLLEHQLANGSSSSSDQPALEAQLVLLDFGLAEQLTDEVRHHFISFLNAISAGDGLCAARHLLRWSHTQACDDPRGFTSDVMDLFSDRCQISSEAGIDLDGVMKAVLGLARKWGVSIDSCYASLVISVCVLVGFAQALDPRVNIMDAVSAGDSFIGRKDAIKLKSKKSLVSIVSARWQHRTVKERSLGNCRHTLAWKGGIEVTWMLNMCSACGRGLCRA
jgi:predicted unusual protein kinase regulating ubiquinone biosynthesis (AarF/ABC1/UbiB family)